MRIDTVQFGGRYYERYMPDLFHALMCIIKEQGQLRQFSIVKEGYPTEFYGIISALESQKNSLQELLIEKCAYSTEFENHLSPSVQNITYLNISYIEFSTQLFELIGNLQKLQFLSLWCYVDHIPDEDMKIQVKQFSEILPLTLQYFDLEDNWLGLYSEIFLNHCNAPLKKLLIYYLDNEKISKALIKFCKRNRALNYVGISRCLKLDDKIRKEVEEYVTLVPHEHIIVNC
ncbi:hypothetical protein F8M41_009232 [Gigaspora margarita]|uniref:Uncharacterized protein n=1 Tax=Gigaspora margarita TaxID=4874 RepID=A0A8H3X3V3_GIGMA|nr:hypothetical protein F8M41_009232 [Gigaspora margarita]